MSKLMIKVTGQERKAVAGIIAAVYGGQAKYMGVPSYNFEAAGWIIDRNSNIKSPEFESLAEISPVFEALKAAGLTTEGGLSIVLSAEGHTGVTLRNLINIIASKGNLLQLALNRHEPPMPAKVTQALNETPIETVSDFLNAYKSGIEAGRYTGMGDMWIQHLPNEIGFCFFNATLNVEEIQAYIALCQKLNEQAKALKYTSAKDKGTPDNPKYAFRCWLLRLGFIGSEYKTERKVLLSALEGNGAYRQVPVETAENNEAPYVEPEEHEAQITEADILRGIEVAKSA